MLETYRELLKQDTTVMAEKCTAAMRMLAYGTPADALDEYLKIGKCTALECLDCCVR